MDEAIVEANPELLSFNEARKNAHDIAAARRRAESEYRKQVEKAADAEANYRKRKAAVFLQSEGTVAEREERSRAATADLVRDRDIQVGLAKACQERIAGLDGERAMLRLLCEWSMRQSEGPQPQWSGNGG